MESRTLRFQRINGKGMEVAQKLAEVLAGKDVELADLGDLHGLDLVDKKEMRLRAFLDKINAARRRLDTEAYGTCVSCSTAFKAAVLDETPWIDRCEPCDQAGK